MPLLCFIEQSKMARSVTKRRFKNYLEAVEPHLLDISDPGAIPALSDHFSKITLYPPLLTLKTGSASDEPLHKRSGLMVQSISARTFD